MRTTIQQKQKIQFNYNMNTENFTTNVNIGDKVYYASSTYEVAEVKEIIPKALVLIGIYDEPPSNHIDYLKPSSLSLVHHCASCQGQGCPTCRGLGYLHSPITVQPIDHEKPAQKPSKLIADYYPYTLFIDSFNRLMILNLVSEGKVYLRSPGKRTCKPFSEKFVNDALSRGQISPWLPGKTITLCGSTKFKAEFIKAHKDLTLCQCPVFTLSFFKHVDGVEFSTAQELILFKVHKAKISQSDAIYVINKNGYIGDQTRREIDFAHKTGKRVYYFQT